MPTRTRTARSTSSRCARRGGGSFMILDLDKSLGGPKNNCDEEVTNPPAIQFPSSRSISPRTTATTAPRRWSTRSTSCTARSSSSRSAMATALRAAAACASTTSSASPPSISTTWAIENKNNSLCQNHTAPRPAAGHDRGNGSSSCIAGWFVRYVTSGPVGAGERHGAGAIGIQLDSVGATGSIREAPRSGDRGASLCPR